MTDSFVTVTEATNCNVSREQLNRMYTRYRFASEFCKPGARVLEVACGSGQGLGYLAKKASVVYALDVDPKLLAPAQTHYVGTPNISISEGDAQKLPFEDASLDMILLYEAVYYLDDPKKAVWEAFRTLSSGGLFIICSANRELPDFNPSPYSKQYFSAGELYAMLKETGFAEITLFGNCLVDHGLRGKILNWLKQTAVRLHLMPKTMRGKEWLKRLVFGKLVPLPPEIKDGMAEYDSPQPLHTPGPYTEHKVIFAVGRKP